MKNIIALVAGIIFWVNGFAQAPNWVWAKSAGGTNIDEGYGIATDTGGNVIVTGYFASPSLAFGATTLTTAGTEDIFLTKYDGSGNVLWAKRFGGTGRDYGKSVTTDKYGKIYTTGYYGSPSIMFGSTTLSNAGIIDIYTMKCDAGGNVLWATKAGSSNVDYSSGIALDEDANVLVTGYYNISPITFGSTTLACLGTEDIFVVKYDSSGNVLWAKRAGGVGSTNSFGIATDANGNIFITGEFAGLMAIFGTDTLTTSGSQTFFIVKYDASGNVLWAKKSGGGACYGKSIATDAIGNAVVTGQFVNVPVTFGTTTLANAGHDDVFVVKYDAGGNVLWAKSAGGSDDDEGWGIATDGSGNVYATGCFSNPTISFDSVTLTSSPGGWADLFVVKYDANGNALWAKNASSPGGECGIGTATNISADVFITGLFHSSPITFGSTVLTNAGTHDCFVAKLSVTVGMVEINAGENISLSPNPATNEITIYAAASGRIELVEIYDVLGQLTPAPFDYAQGDGQSERSRRLQIDVSKLAPGIYFVKVRGEKGEAVVKLVKE